MRVWTCCFMLVAGLLAGTVVADEAESPYSRVATGKAPQKDGSKVYTNADLGKMFGIVEQDREQPATETETEAVDPDAPADMAASADTAAKPGDRPDSLAWLRQRQKTQREQRVALAEAQAGLRAARENLAKLERQQLSTRNPFSARPELTDEEKAKRREGGETAAQRYERTTQQLEEARNQVRAAGAEVDRLRAQRP